MNSVSSARRDYRIIETQEEQSRACPYLAISMMSPKLLSLIYMSKVNEWDEQRRRCWPRRHRLTMRWQYRDIKDFLQLACSIFCDAALRSGFASPAERSSFLAQTVQGV